jgi:type I restriction enzyme S subunit
METTIHRPIHPNECARIDAKKAKTEKRIELLNEYRTALISEMVRGKIKVV